MAGGMCLATAMVARGDSSVGDGRRQNWLRGKVEEGLEVLTNACLRSQRGRLSSTGNNGCRRI